MLTAKLEGFTISQEIFSFQELFGETFPILVSCNEGLNNSRLQAEVNQTVADWWIG